MEDAEPEEIEVGSAVHGTLDELEPVDVALDRSVAPGLLKGCEEGGFVATEMFCEATQRTGSGVSLPLGPCRGVAFPDDAAELTRRCGKRCDLRGTAVELIEEGPCLLGLLQ